MNEKEEKIITFTMKMYNEIANEKFSADNVITILFSLIGTLRKNIPNQITREIFTESLINALEYFKKEEKRKNHVFEKNND